MKNEFQVDVRLITETLCAALDFDRACPMIKIIDEPEGRIFQCRRFHCTLEKEEIKVGYRKITICRRCEQCLQDFGGGIKDRKKEN